MNRVDHKISVLKYANRNITRLLTVFASTKFASNYIKEAQCN